MSLHNGIDTTAYVSLGNFSKTYGASDTDQTADLFVSLGLFESAPDETVYPVVQQLINWFFEVY